jgi:hypothetical protein
MDLEHRLCIDKEKIYATGLGTGAGMVHLAACDSTLSSKIAAYAAINLNIFSGIRGESDKRTDEEDPSLLPWQFCDSQRKPARILEIHTENNTLFDYYGENEVNGKSRWPIVQWLVGWAKSECGMPLSEPERWKAIGGAIFKTDLEKGHIFEGFSENQLVTKASYHCWGDTPAETKPKEEYDNKIAVDTKDLVELAENLRSSIVIEHYYLRGFAHGWPRVSMLKPTTEDGEADHSKVETPEWNEIGDRKDDQDLSFNDKDAFTFGQAFTTMTPAGKEIEFDATSHVLGWFRMFKLSDESAKPFEVKSYDEESNDQPIADTATDETSDESTITWESIIPAETMISDVEVLEEIAKQATDEKDEL